MWTYSDNYDILANLYIRSCYKDGVLKRYEIYPCEGYVLRIPYLDDYQYDENGNYVLDENGNPIIVPYRTYGGASARLNYDWQANPNGYVAELYEEGMIVFGNNPEHEIM